MEAVMPFQDPWGHAAVCIRAGQPAGVGGLPTAEGDGGWWKQKDSDDLLLKIPTREDSFIET